MRLPGTSRLTEPGIGGADQGSERSGVSSLDLRQFGRDFRVHCIPEIGGGSSAIDASSALLASFRCVLPPHVDDASVPGPDVRRRSKEVRPRGSTAACGFIGGFGSG